MDSSIAELKAELKKKEDLLQSSSYKKTSERSHTGGRSTFQKVFRLSFPLNFCNYKLRILPEIPRVQHECP